MWRIFSTKVSKNALNPHYCKTAVLVAQPKIQNIILEKKIKIIDLSV
jgi:hypothetical protein